jgi:hypothetical protein
MARPFSAILGGDKLSAGIQVFGKVDRKEGVLREGIGAVFLIQ